MSPAHPSTQPNVPGRGITASYSRRFWAAVVVIGVGAGLGAAALILLLRAVQHLAWDYSSGPFLNAVENTSSGRRVIVLTIGGVVAGAGVVALSRYATSDVSEALWLRRARLPLLPSLARAAHSIVIVALGASLGREAAPQQAGAALASTLGERAGLPEWQRRLLVACGAGAGMAAVYNIPLGGALFALEVLLGTLALPFVLPALATALIATAVAWVYIPKAPTYLIAEHITHPTQIVWAAIAGPVAGVVSVLYVRLIIGANRIRPRTRSTRLLAPIVVFAALGVLAIAYPQVLGNGRSVVQLTLVAQLAAGLTAVLLILKPLATAGCLGSGAPGGLFTPTLAVGVLLGSLGGRAWELLWPGAPLGTYAVIGGAAVLAASMQAPLAGIVLMLELTHRAEGLLVPILLAVVGATVVSRRMGAHSIYSARLTIGRQEEAAARAAEREGMPA
ncbi:MAG TPA: chloride channel protein [Solirubrobacteraceae bacterium]|nr:chloride channel protein [Solirubrobacteraceae bacterium]